MIVVTDQMQIRWQDANPICSPQIAYTAWTATRPSAPKQTPDPTPWRV